MQNKPNNIDKLFNTAFKDAVLEPTPNAWNKIVSAISGKYMVPATWWYAAAAALFLGGIGVGYLWNTPKLDDTNYAKATIENSSPAKVEHEIESPSTVLPTITEQNAITPTVSASTLAESHIKTEKKAPKSLKNSTPRKTDETAKPHRVDVETVVAFDDIQPLAFKMFDGFANDQIKPGFLVGKNTVDKLKLDELYALFAKEDKDVTVSMNDNPTLGGRISSGYSNTTSDRMAMNEADYFQSTGGLTTSKNSISQSTSMKYNRSIGLGIDGTYPLTERLSMRYGLNFTRWNATGMQEVVGDVYSFDYNSNAQILVEDVVIDSKTYDYKISFLEVPLTVKWNFLSKKVKAFISSGISLSYLTAASRIEMDANQFSTGATKEVVTPTSGRMPFSVIASTGLEYQLMKGLNVRVEPIFRAQLNKDETLNFNYPFNSVSLNTGVYYSIN